MTDIASKAQQNTNTTNITNINNTIAKGLNFKGDDATVINKKLGEQLDIKGGADASKLTDGNIGVVSGNGAECKTGERCDRPEQCDGRNRQNGRRFGRPQELCNRSGQQGLGRAESGGRERQSGDRGSAEESV